MYVADLHTDVLQRAMVGEDITKKSRNGHVDLVRLKEAKIDLEVFVIWVTHQYIKTNTAFARANQLIDKLESIQKISSDITIIKSPNEVQKVKNASKIATPFAIEGGECLENNLENLMHFIRRGMLYFGPTWNYSNTIATSAYDEMNNLSKLKHLGLSEFGLEVIQLCESEKIIVDVSHIGEKSFWDILEITSNPLIASHSCVHRLCPHYRNLKDDQIIAIKKKRGGVFINLYPNFIDPYFKKKEKALKLKLKLKLNAIDLKYTNPDQRWLNKQSFLQKELQSIAPDIESFIDHIDYVVKLVGVDYVGIGSDYDGIDCLPKQLLDCTNHLLIAEKLDQRGYLSKDIEKIMGLNFLRIYKEITSK